MNFLSFHFFNLVKGNNNNAWSKLHLLVREFMVFIETKYWGKKACVCVWGGGLWEEVVYTGINGDGKNVFLKKKKTKIEKYIIIIG